MESTNTQRSTQTSEADRLQQEHNRKIRDIKKQQENELKSLTDKHERDMKTADSAYRVEITAKKEEYEKKIQETNERQQLNLANVTNANEMSLKQAQETYRMQAEDVRAQGERKLNMLREQQLDAQEGISRKGNA